MLRSLLILVLFVCSGTGCSGTRPFLSPVVVTLPGLSFHRLPTEESGAGPPLQSPILREPRLPRLVGHRP